jgi:hypothetical protein
MAKEKTRLHLKIEECVKDLSWKGKDLVGICPKCQQETFSYAPKHDFWWCWNCKNGGKYQHFIQHIKD